MARTRHKPKKNPILEYRRLSTTELRERIRQCRERGNLRTAIDIAKECYRREPTPACTELLGGLYLDRGRQFAEKNLPTEALMVLSNALALGQGSVELLRLVFECGLRSGQYASALSTLKRLADPAERARASCLLADEAVAGGSALGRLCEPALQDDVARIQRAFAAFERADDAAVAAELKPIGLGSPCAGWKWVLRGLTAYVQREPDHARSSWGRAGTSGRAARLGELLRSTLTPDPSAGRPASSPLSARVAGLFDSPRQALLQQIKQALDAGKGNEVLDLCGRLLADIKPQDREVYARRLGRAVLSSMNDEGWDAWRFSRFLGTPPEDPQLLRTAAVAAESCPPGQAIGIWQRYLNTVKQVAAIPPHLKGRARAMIWQRMGTLAERLAGPDDLPHRGWFSWLRRRGPDPVDYYRNSLKEYPDDLKAWEKLVKVLVGRGDDRQAERVSQEVLARWPNHVDSLLLLGSACLERRALRKALGFFERARQAEPFNRTICQNMQFCYLLSARRRLEGNRLDLARRDYAQAETLQVPGESSASLYCKWAALEWRAGDPARAEALLERAEASGDDRTALYYQLVIDLDRAGAPAEVQARFRSLLDEEWKKEPTAAAAVAMIRLMLALDVMDVSYGQREAHDRALCEYLRRAADKVTFTEAQLLVVCTYLESVGGWGVLVRVAGQGAERFPGSYLFPLFLGRAQRQQGRRRLPRATRRLLDQAGERAMQAGKLETATEIAALLMGGGRYRRGRRDAVVDDADDEAGLGDPFGRGDVPAPAPHRGRREYVDPFQLPLFTDVFDPDLEEA